jgi:hypothetical protein
VNCVEPISSSWVLVTVMA